MLWLSIVGVSTLIELAKQIYKFDSNKSINSEWQIKKYDLKKINICEWQTQKYGLNKSIIWKWQTQEYELNHKLPMANIGEGNLVLTYVTGSILGAYRPRPLMKAHNLQSPCTYVIFGERKYMFWLYVPISQCTRQCAIKGNKGPQPIFCGPKFQWLNKWW